MLDQTKVWRLPLKSGIVIFAWRVAWSYAYSPFKSSEQDTNFEIACVQVFDKQNNLRLIITYLTNNIRKYIIKYTVLKPIKLVASLYLSLNCSYIYLSIYLYISGLV